MLHDTKINLGLFKLINNIYQCPICKRRYSMIRVPRPCSPHRFRILKQLIPFVCAKSLYKLSNFIQSWEEAGDFLSLPPAEF